MAFCKSKLSDVEDSKDESYYEDSLENVRAFSTSRRQFYSPSSEGLLTKKDDKVIDRRTLIEFHEKKWDTTNYHTPTQLVVKLGNVKCSGSGITAVLSNGRRCLLTCAHNLIADSLGSRKFFDKIVMYQSREGANSYRGKFKLDPTTVRIHPCYCGSPETGFDIGVCDIATTLGAKNWKKLSFPVRQDTVIGPVNPEKLQKGREVQVNAYPGEKKGFPYTSSGKVTHVLKKKNGGWVVYYSADTTPGVSGGPISLIIEDEKDLKELGAVKLDKYTYPFKQTIGVHTGHDPFSNMNYGTLITNPLWNWVNGVNDTDTTCIIS